MEDDQQLSDDSWFVHHQMVADPKQTPIRLDRYLMDRLPNVTRNKLQEGIRQGFVKVNNQQVKPNYKVRPADQIVVALPEPPRDTDVVPENIALDITYEDEHLMVVNKPPGMVVHPAYNNWTGTLVNALAFHFQNLPTMPDNQGRPGLVHRIDKDTSGLLVIAKTELAMAGLARQFYDHSIERSYTALVWGEPEPEAGTVKVNLGRSFKDRRVTAAFPDGEHGRNAITHYQVVQRMRYVSLLTCRLETGRTHQIRAHMKYLGHPLFNDSTYGGDRILKGTVFSKYKAFVENCFKILPRQALHAKSLGFIHPATGKSVQFDSELPEDFQQLITKWSNYIDNSK
ncbi:MAG: pseudouridine synthase [Cyclobacteriaceae bacterium]|nr:MAG: pseudouridine synthase [Cyclobacteriaceae bacterium]